MKEKKKWFKQKYDGPGGMRPHSWQGWLLSIIFVSLLLIVGAYFDAF